MNFLRILVWALLAAVAHGQSIGEAQWYPPYVGPPPGGGGAGGTVLGSGTAGTVPVWTDPTTLGDSSITSPAGNDVGINPTTNRVVQGADTDALEQYCFDTAGGATSACLQYGNSLGGPGPGSLGPGWILRNRAGQAQWYLPDVVPGAQGSGPRADPLHDVGGDATVRTLFNVAGESGPDGAVGWLYQVGARQYPAPLDNEVSPDEQYHEVEGSSGIDAQGPVFGGGGTYFGSIGRTSFVSRDGKFLGSSASGIFNMIPNVGNMTCDGFTGGPGSGSDPCLDPDHQGATMLFTMVQFGVGNFDTTGRPFTYSAATELSGAAGPDALFGTALVEHFSEAAFPVHAFDGGAIVAPYGFLALGRNASGNGIPGLIATDPVISLAYAIDLDVTGGVDAPICWGDANSRMCLGAQTLAGGLAHKRLELTEAGDLRMPMKVPGQLAQGGDQEISSAGTFAILKEASYVYVDSTAGNVMLTLPDCVTNTEGYIWHIKRTGGANMIDVDPFGTKTIDNGGAGAPVNINDHISIRCKNATDGYFIHSEV